MTANDLDLGKILYILRARLPLILGLLAASLAIATIITLYTPKMYRAATSLNFEFKTNPVDSRGQFELTEKTYLNTQMGIMESYHVAQEVVDSLSDYETDRFISSLEAQNSELDKFKYSVKESIKSLFEAKPEAVPVEGMQIGASKDDRPTLNIGSPGYSWIARAAGGNLEVTPLFGSRIVEVAYLSTDPKIAALMANRYADAYIAVNLKMIVDPAYRSKIWFDEQLKSLRKSLEDAQERLTAYQQEQGIVTSDERLGIETARLQELNGQLVAARQNTRNSETEREKLKALQASNASLDTFQPVFNNAVVQKIKGEIRDLEGRIAQNSDTLGDNHPEMKQLRSELYQARKKLDAEVDSIIDGTNNATELSRERESMLADEVEAQKKVVLQLKTVHDRIAVLEREVESSQSTYNAALNQLNTTSMQSLVDQTNVTIVDVANVPRTHSTPSFMKNLALGGFAGLLLGVGLAILLETIGRRIHAKDDFTDELEIPLLGHLKKV